jgi:hypothetical protein
MRIRALLQVLLLSGSLLSPASAEDEIPAGDFNFVYGAILGTGFYSVGEERVLIMQLPLSWKFAPLDDKNGLKLLLPVSLGVRNIIGEDGDFEVPDQLLTFSLLPGIAWERKQAEKWLLVPIVQLGGAVDLQSDAEAWLFSASLRSFAWWDVGKHRLGLGNRVLGAGQFAGTTQNKTGFMLLENGLDWDYSLPWLWRGDHLSGSLFMMWRHYADDVNIDAVSGESLGLENVYTIGFTFGVRREAKPLWKYLPIRRAGIAFGAGNTISGGDFKSITFNLGFPLSYN